MSIIIDTNCLSAVFNRDDSRHEDFKPVKEWILKRKGRVVYGGTKYKNELSRTKYLNTMQQLNNAGLVVKIKSDSVDRREEEVINQTKNDSSCNDQHIIAIAGVSRCRLICSADRRAYPHFKRNDLYPKGISHPKIYSSRDTKDLLRDKYANVKLLEIDD